MPVSRKDKTLLIVVGGLGVGGTEIHLSRVLPSVHGTGFSVTVFSMAGHGIIGERLAENGVQVVCAPSGHAISNWPKVFRRVLLLPLICGALLWHMWRLRPQITHFFLPEAYLVGAVCSFFAPCGRRVMSRRSLNSYQANRPLSARIERWLHGRMDLILANSLAVAKQLRDEGVAEGDLRIIKNGFSPPEPNIAADAARNALVSNFGLSAGHFVMISVANLIPYKGHKDLLTALSRIRLALPQPWVLFCVGRDDGIQQELQRMSCDLAVEGNVVFCGSRPDAWVFQRGADLGVFSSLEEGSPNAVLEYMHAGLPVVSTAAGGVVDLLEGEQSNYVVEVADISAFAEKILELAQNKELRMRLGKANHRKAAMEFSLPACVSAYRQMYFDVAR